jgi:hypothetical protein
VSGGLDGFVLTEDGLDGAGVVDIAGLVTDLRRSMELDVVETETRGWISSGTSFG